MADRPVCPPGCGCSVGNEFGERAARQDLRAYRRSGAGTTTRWLVDGLGAGGVVGLTVLDIGAGVGAAHQALLAQGVAAVTDVDGSPAYIAAAREEAERQGTADRVTYQVGDFVELAADIPAADLVVLDRVICCYPDMEALVRASVGHARVRYGLVYPRDSWWIRAGATVLNGLGRIFRMRTRAYVHRTGAVDAIVRAAGFAPRLHRTTLFWQVAVYERAAA
jgi:magnesium-protoporphyrin O-methyltransferase